MNEELKLKNGNKYPLIVNGFSVNDECMTVAIVCNDKTLEEVLAEFSNHENTEVLTVENETEEIINICDGYVILDSHASLDVNYEICPAEYGRDEEVTKEAVYGKVAFLTLHKETVEQRTTQNEADIDYLALMTGVELFRG